MRLIRLLPIAIAGLAAATLSACAPRQEAAGPTPLAWTMEDLQRSWCADAADTLPEVWISLHYPRFTSGVAPAAADSLNGWVRRALVAAARTDSTPGDLESLAGRMISNYQAVRRRAPPSPAPAWFYENEVLVSWDSLGLVSMASTADSYTGGAHGAAVRVHGVLDASTGRRLGLGDLIAPGSLDSLALVAEAAFRAARNLASDAALDRSGFWFDGGRFQLTPNFGLDRDGLVFHYNPYEVAPYAMGPTTIRLRWEEIGGLLRAGGPLELLGRHPPS